MGLDMYLYRRQYAKPVNKGVLQVTRKGETTTIEPEVPTELKEEIGYWRKANHIHAWFVDNVADGEDKSLEEYRVTRDQLAKLLETVEEVLKHSKLVPGEMVTGRTLEGGKWVNTVAHGFVIADPTVAKTLLPRREGFFFGSTDYDQWYVDDLRETVKILKGALASSPDVTFTYQSWW